MRRRREFAQRVKLQAWDRCGGCCEHIDANGKRCGRKLMPGRLRYDHRIPDELGGEPTLENCQVICEWCDAPKTRQDQADIAKARHVRARHVGAHAPRRPMPGSRKSPWKRRMDGTVVRR